MERKTNAGPIEHQQKTGENLRKAAVFAPDGGYSEERKADSPACRNTPTSPNQSTRIERVELAPAMIPGALIDRSKGVTMTIDDPRKFGQAFSDLTNSLQRALHLAAERATAVRAETAAVDELYASVSRAVEAARQLRAAGATEKGKE
jgi:hypothetical protein